jgi:hypothetical protein
MVMVVVLVVVAVVAVVALTVYDYLKTVQLHAPSITYNLISLSH